MRKFGPTDTFRSIFGTTPGLATDAVANSLTFVYGDFDVPGGSSQVIDILFTVTASDNPFADGLFLTNQARRSQDTTNASDFVNDAIVQIELAMPELSITKGIVATDNPSAIFSVTPPGPVTFTAPGTAGYRGSGIIHSNGLDSSPIDSNLQNLDAGDLVTFAVIVENTGTSRTGAFDISLRDTLPAGFAVPGAETELDSHRWNCAAINFTPINGGLFDASGGIELVDPGPTAAQPDLTDAGALDEYDATDGENILVLTYDLEVTGSVTPNQLITNTATLAYYAGAEGGPDFTTTDLTDTATAVTASIDVAKTIAATSEPSTVGNDVVIGELVTYSSVITVPEGVANNVTWTDIPDAGFSIVDILSVTASSTDLSTSAGTFAAVQAAAAIATNGDSMTLDFQTLSNANRVNATPETITIQYRVATLNTATNVRNTALTNLATVTWTGGADSVSAPNVTVREPALSVTKSIVPASGQATDTFLVTLDLAHTVASNADAFEVVLSDILPAGLVFAGGLTSSGTAPSSLSQLANTVTADWNSFAQGDTAQIQFNVQLSGSVQPNQIITNAATATWTSLPGAVTSPQSSDPVSTERTGSNADPGGSANDYSATGNDTLTVIAPAFSKSIIATNQAHTAGNNVAIGEIVTYRAVVTIPQSTLTGVTFVDTPTPGLAIVDVLSVTADPALSTSIGTMSDVATSAVIPADGSTLTLDFGTLTNTDNNSVTNETITIEYRAIVLNTNTNDRGDTLDNQAVFQWNAGSSVSTDAADLTIVEPSMQISKSFSPTTSEANDTVHVTVNLFHNVASDADTFNVQVTDLLPAGMTFAGNLVSTGALAADTLSESGGIISAGWDTFALSDTARIEFDVTLDVGAQLGSVIQNVSNIQWTSLPGNVTTPQSGNGLSTERTGNLAQPGGAANDYNTNAAANFTMASPAIAKSLTASNQAHSLGTDVVIGEIVTYQTTVTVPQGTLSLARLVDAPDAGLAIVDVIGITASNTVSTSIGTMADVANNAVVAGDGSSVTFDFGTVVNNDSNSGATETIVVTYRAVVLNTPGNNRGVTLDNLATFSWNGNGGVNADAADLSIVEPEMVVTVSNGNPATADAGDLVTFTVTVQHAGTSDVDARDVSLVNLIDSLPNHLQYVPGTLSISSTGAPVLISASDTGGDLSIIWSQFPLGSTATLTYQTRVQNSAPPVTALTNPADLTWTSATGDLSSAQSSNPLSVERTGDITDPGTTSNDYLSQDIGSVLTSPAQGIKTVTNTSLAHTGSGQHNAGITDLAVGEIITYVIEAILPEGTTTLGIIDQLPTLAGTLEFVSVQVSSIGANLTIPAGRPTEFRSDTDNDTIDDQVILDFGSVLNTPDGVSNSDDEIRIEISAVVLDVGDNFNGQIITNTALIDVGSTPVIARADAEIVEPVLQIDKVVVPITGPAGDTLLYTLSVSHAGTSTSDAFDLIVADTLSDPNLFLIPGSVTTSAGTVTTGNGITDATVEVNLATFPLTDTLTVTFQAITNPSLSAGVVINNTATLGWDALPGPGGRTGSDNDPAAFTTTPPQVDLVLTKSDQPDPVVVDSTLTYTLTVENAGPSTATNVVIVDSLPAQITVDTVSTNRGSTSLVGTTLTGLVGVLLPGESATITVVATAPSTEQTLTNSASVTANETDIDLGNNTVSQPTQVVLTSDLSGAVWVDTNGNGVLEPSEQPLPGVLLTLTGTNDLGQPINATTTTLGDGSYLFAGLRPGTYTVIETQPTLFVDAPDYLGSAGGSVANDQFTVTLAAGVDAVLYNFTERGLRGSAISKRLLLLSSLASGGSPTQTMNSAALDTIFAQLASTGSADLDHDGDVDSDDYNLMLASLGGTFNWP